MSDDGLTGLYIAYSLVWLGLLTYLIYIHMLQERLRKEMSNLKRRMKGSAKKRKLE